MKLNQILAIEKGLKTDAERRLTALHHQLQKPDLLTGLSRVYEKRDAEDPEIAPPGEQKHVQIRAEDTLTEIRTFLTEYWDAAGSKEATNQAAQADLIVDGKTLVVDVPATMLLFLEKQLVNLTTYLEKLPVLDPAETWQKDEGQQLFVTPEKLTIRSRKVPRAFEKAPATKEHPAQVDSYFEDVGVGTWHLRLMSGAVEASRRRTLVARAQALSRAVKTAREAANLHEVVEKKVGRALFDFLLAK